MPLLLLLLLILLLLLLQTTLFLCQFLLLLHGLELLLKLRNAHTPRQQPEKVSFKSPGELLQYLFCWDGLFSAHNMLLPTLSHRADLSYILCENVQQRGTDLEVFLELSLVLTGQLFVLFLELADE